MNDRNKDRVSEAVERALRVVGPAERAIERVVEEEVEEAPVSS